MLGLIAGAIAGGASSVNSLADQAIKEAEEAKRQAYEKGILEWKLGESREDADTAFGRSKELNAQQIEGNLQVNKQTNDAADARSNKSNAAQIQSAQISASSRDGNRKEQYIMVDDGTGTGTKIPYMRSESGKLVPAIDSGSSNQGPEKSGPWSEDLNTLIGKKNPAAKSPPALPVQTQQPTQPVPAAPLTGYIANRSDAAKNAQAEKERAEKARLKQIEAAKAAGARPSNRGN